jgi:hypothetical protein
VLDTLKHHLQHSPERKHKLAAAAEAVCAGVWGGKVAVLVALFVRHGLALPAEVAPCVAAEGGLVGAGVECGGVGQVLQRLQVQWNAHALLLGLRDHIVTPDYLEVLPRLIELHRSACAACWGVTVRWGCMRDDDSDERKVCRSHSVINTGIAFARSTYEAIRASDFDDFGDGWDWSLFHLAQTGQLGAGDMMLGPAVSRIRNIGRRGATVTAEGADPHLLRQLDYNNIGELASARLADELYTHSEEQRQYTPPCWEPLFLGGVGFVAQQ